MTLPPEHPAPPSHRRAEAEALAAPLSPLLAAAMDLSQSVGLGTHGRRRAGPGADFWQYRALENGEAAGAIDWRRSARGPSLYVREREWTVSQTVWLWRDGSESMRWRSRLDLPTKLERASLLLLSLAVLLNRGGERFGWLGQPSLPVGGDMAHVTRLTAALDLQLGENAPEHAPTHGGAMVLMSDFLHPIEQWRERLERWRNLRLRGHLLHLLDPAEETFPYQGRVQFHGVEGEPTITLSRCESLRTAYQQKLQAHRDALASLARHQGWSVSTHTTADPPRTILAHLAQTIAQDRRDKMSR